jgi:hypothetical protein
MGCREFDPSLDRFCSEPKDFVSHAQIVQMATFFGMKGSELRKVDLMASREESSRSRNAPEQNAGVSPEAHTSS